jgi:hypothetical protein
VPTKLELKGLAEFRKALQNLPEDLREEADVIVQAQADEAQRQIRAAYPEGPTGNLRRGVTKSKEERSRFTSRAIVRSRAPHSHLFERGTRNRKTGKGWNRGAMPAAAENEKMIPIVIRRRRVMVEALKDVVRKAGFQVNE